MYLMVRESIVTSLVVFILIAAIATPAILGTFKSLILQKRKTDSEVKTLYEDEDGVATEQSQNQYSSTLPRYVLLASMMIGLSIALGDSVYSSVHSEGGLSVQCWITFGSWTLLVFQALSVLTERSTVHRYNLGIQAATTFALLIIAICVENGFLLSKITSPSFYVFHFVFIILQLGAATISLFACLFLPRRPSVYHKSQTVDKQYTVSAINRWTWTWASEFLSLARINKRLNLSDVPQLHFGARSSYLAGHFTLMKPRDRLWKTLFRVHWREFMVQWLLSLAQGVIQFAPQLAMYKLLELLEDQSEKTSIAAIAWAYVIGLGASIILAAWMEAWLHWIVLGRLGLLVRIELSALIFSKSMRRKDVKGVQKITGASTNISYGADEPSTNEMIDHGENDAVHIVSSTGLDHGTVGQSTDQPEIQAFIQPTDQPGAQSGVQLAQQPGNHVMDDLEDSQVSRQSTINLIAIDAKRIADFATFHFIFPQTAAKLGASVLFLVQLIGWKSLLAGFIGAALITPLNIYASKKFSNSQGDLMSARDRKMVVITEALHGIRQIKFSASERQWQTRIGEKRRIELAAQRRTFLWDAVLITIWILGPVMLSAISLAVYAVLHGDLSPSVAFTTITVFGQIEAVLAIIPELTAEALEAWISVNRIGEYLNAPEMEIYITPGTDISFENASLAWPSDAEHGEPDRFILKNVNVSFPNKELSVISGKTGAGKSLLLASILGEAELLGGNVHVPKVLRERYDDRANKGNWIIDSAIAFVAQIPWIENASIKDNILFDLPYDTNRYRKVLESCALMKDLKNLPDGELTDIGAQGINLSGGQRWRISFARALYSRAGILILDDIFSAVDAHVGRQLFEDALTGELGQGRTRLLVTHHVELCLPRTKYAVILGEGTVQNAGFVEDLQQNGSLGEILKRNEEIQEKDDQVKGHLVESPDTNGETLGKLFSRTTETSVSIGSDEPNANVEAQPKKFVEDEKREIGSVKIGIYKEYLMTSGGFWAWIPILFMFLVHQGLILGRSWWISLWTRSYSQESESMSVQQPSLYNLYKVQSKSDHSIQENPNLSFYLSTYIAISILICVTGSLRYLFVLLGALRASHILFENLLYSVLRAPLRWLDTVPVGRILNRFTADFAVVDSRMGNDLGFMMYQVIQLVGIIIASLFVSPFMLLLAVIISAICVFIASRFLAGAREVKRLESNTKSPIYEQFRSSLAGISTIRGFEKSNIYIDRMYANIDAHARTYWYLWLSNRWMAIRLNAVGAVFAVLVAVVVVSVNGIDASLAGFALSFALQYSSAITWTIRQYTNVELGMNATERIVEYSRIPTEDQSSREDANGSAGQVLTTVPAAWPKEGRLEVNGLVAGYAPDLPPVLKGLSFNVSKNQRIGVIGRTGAGKSSLTLALFRFLEAREGSIHIDGVDISKISLYDLRSRLAIIPQDPVLFSGSVRSNLDAFDEHTDTELYDALERVHLIFNTGASSRDEPIDVASRSGAPPLDTNINLFKSLSSRISEGGLNLSQGQRQLLCLARAIVCRPKIMVLDEATSAVDMATDVLIQRSIREEFEDSTLLVIAHRLSTIADFDKILVMADGKAVEFDSPKVLLKSKGLFWEMVNQSGEKNKLEHIILGPRSRS